MTDTKAPERIWADVIVWGDMEPLAGEWNCRDVGRTEDTEYIRKDLYDALAKERDELQAEIARLTAERDQALARAAAAAMEMRERAAEVCDDDGVSTTSDAEGRMIAVWLSDVASEIRALPIDPDDQKALDKLLAKAREDAIREAEEAASKVLWDYHGDMTPEMAESMHDAILAPLNDGGRDE